MNNGTNILTRKNKKDLETLKNRLYDGKKKRLDMIDGFIDRVQAELKKRDLSEIPTAQLARILGDFVALAVKEYPEIELQYHEKRDDFSYLLEDTREYATDKVIL